MIPYTNRERWANIMGDGRPEAYPGQKEKLLASLIASDVTRAAEERELASLARLGGNLYRERLADVAVAYRSNMAAKDGFVRDDAASIMSKRSHDASLPEAAFDWPIYRAAMVADVYGALWGQASDSEERVLDTLAHCAGLSTNLTPAVATEAELPQVYVNISGGVAETTVTRGQVEVIQHDWDNLAFNADYSREDLLGMREQLSKVANSEYRARLLADIDAVMDRYQYEEA